MTEVMAKHPPIDLRWAEKVPALILLAALLFLGFWPKSISTSLNETLVELNPVVAPQDAPMQTVSTAVVR
jgi:NADH-quinone oxidoreductase subunit M